MRKKCVFEQNVIHNFQIEEQFDQIMQIQGLGHNNYENKELFPSIKHFFNPKNVVNIIGEGPNANIKSFYYLLLCHIRKQHLKRLVTQFRKRQFDNADSDDQQLAGRGRRVSFNDKGALFVNGPQYENYCLHKLKIFAFSRQTDLAIIQGTPFQKQSTLRFKGEKLTSNMMKKLLSQFLKELLPIELNKNYKEELKSVKYYLNKHKCIGIIMTIIMRFILLQKYEVASAKDYSEQVNDHTVCTTLCDAFAIDGLLCRDNVYQINTWCKVHSFLYSKKKIFFIEMYNDQYQQLGETNQRRISIQCKKNDERSYSMGSNLLSSEEKQNKKSAAFGYQNSASSSSIMGEDQDSEIHSSSQGEWQKVQNNIRAVQSQQFKSLQEHSNSLSNTFRQTFNSNKQSVQQSILTELQKQDSFTIQYGATKEENGFQNIRSNSPSFPTIIEQKDEKNEFDRFKAKQSSRYEKESDRSSDFTPQELLESLKAQKSKGVRVIKIGYRQQQQPSIVNNNINNNIYVNLGGNSLPVINITTKKQSQTSDSYIKINLS